jgi:spermidine/putrescine transport system permease protein
MSSFFELPEAHSDLKTDRASALGTTRSTAGPGRAPGLAGWGLLAPLLLWLACFVLAPAALLIVYSFCTRDELGRVVPEFTWDNFGRVFDPIYLRIFARSLGYAGLTTVACLIGGYPAAWFIARQAEPARSRWIAAVTIPFWTSFLLRTYAWIAILKQQGLLNAILTGAGLAAHPAGLLYTPAAVIIGLVYVYLPFMILPIYGNAEKLDGQLIEAAHDLGASPAQVFRRIILPLTWPGVQAGIVMVFVPALGMFAVTDLLGGGRTPLLGNVIQNQFTQARDWPFGAALGVVFLGLFAGSFWLLQRRTRVGELGG